MPPGSVPAEPVVPDPSGGAPPATPRWWLVLAAVPLVVGAFAQRVGEITTQTRMERVLDPLTSIVRTLELWDPTVDMGAIPNQSVGYLLSFDPPFVLGHVLGVAPWITERLVIAVVLVAALWGFVRLLDALAIGSPLTRMVGGLAFALAPVMLSRVGWRLPEALAPALLPLVLLPLVRASAGGSTRRGAAWSGIVVVLIGGANAVVTASVVAVPALYLLTRQRGPRRASLMRWWLLAMVLATTWWAVGLPFLSRYGADLLAFTESVDITTAPATLFNVLRGSADWLVSLDGGGYVPAATSLARRTVPIVGVGVLTAVGLGGLALRGLPERRFLIAVLAVGVAVVGGATLGWFANPAAELYRAVLSGPLEPLRNVYKFSGLVAFPVAVGFTHALARIPAAVAALGRRLGRGRAAAVRGWVAPVVVTTVALVALAGVAYPLVTGALLRVPGFAEEPAAWVEAKSWLAEEASGRVLVTPGQTEASYDWGLTSQVPLQWGSDLRWATRSQLPLSGAPTMQYLDAIEFAIERGGAAGLADVLTRGGFSHILVPNDSVSGFPDLPAPERVASALERSGLRRVAGFGPDGFGFGDLRQLDIYAVGEATTVTAYPVASASWLSGGVESVLDVPTADVGDRAWVLVRDGAPEGIDPGLWLITDGNQRSVVDFGLHRVNRSGVLGAFDTEVNGDPVAARRWVVDEVANQTTLEHDGVRQITASSVGPGPLLRASPGAQPANVLDGDPTTVWLPVVADGGVVAQGAPDPWLEVRFDEARRVDPLGVELRYGFFRRPEPVVVTVTTDAGEVSTTLDAVAGPQRLGVPAGPTSTLRVTLDAESVAAGEDWVGIGELDLPGPPTTPRLAVPAELEARFADPSTAAPGWVLTRNRPSSSPAIAVPTEPAIARRLGVPRPLVLEVRATAAVGRSAELVAALGALGPVTVEASGTFVDRAAVAPRNVLDGDDTSVWRSGQRTSTQRATSAWLALGWEGEREVDQLVLETGPALAVPTSAVVTMGDESRLVPVGPDGTVGFAPLRGNRLVVTLLYPPDPEGADARPVGLVGLEVPAFDDLPVAALDPALAVPVGCDAGLELVVGDEVVPLSATVPLGVLIDGGPFPLEPCGDTGVALPAGDVIVEATDGPYGIAVDQVVLARPPLLSTDTGARRDVVVERWDSNDRAVRIDAGDAAILTVSETFNVGWEARLAGERLEPMQVDGWRQGFVVPAGEGGPIELTYAPNRVFRAGVAAGMVMVVVLVALALLPSRQRPMPAVGEGRWPTWLVVVSVVGVAVWSTGVAAVALVPLWWVGRRRRTALGWVAAASFVTAAFVVALTKGSLAPWQPWWEAVTTPVTVLSALALLAVLASLLPSWWRGGRDPADAPPPTTPAPQG